jgi:hypothetical protein
MKNNIIEKMIKFNNLPLECLQNVNEFVGCPDHFVGWSLNDKCYCKTLKVKAQQKLNDYIKDHGRRYRTNEFVVLRWLNNLKWKSKNMSTDGKCLYSYKLMIGYTTSSLQKIIIDYTVKGGHFSSLTTSRHCNLAKQHAHKEERPS